MDPTLIAEEPTGIVAWVTEWGQIAYFFGQMLFWAALIVLLFYAVWQYKRWVNYQLGTGRSGELRKAKEGETTSDVKVDEFVD